MTHSTPHSILRVLGLVFVLLTLMVHAAGGQTCDMKTVENEAKVLCDAEEVFIRSQPKHNIDRAVVSMGASTEDTAVALIIATESAGWNFSSEDTAFALIDGEKFQFDVVDGGGEIDDGAVFEQKYVVISPETSVRVAQADSFQLKIGDAVFEVGDEVRGQMNVLINKFAQLR